MNRQNTIIAAALLAALAIVCPRVSKGQETHQGESFELDGTLVSTRSFEYKANNYIWLKKGFYSNPQSPNYAMLEIDPYFNPETPYGNEVWWSPDHPSSYAGKVGTIPTIMATLIRNANNFLIFISILPKFYFDKSIINSLLIITDKLQN